MRVYRRQAYSRGNEPSKAGKAQKTNHLRTSTVKHGGPETKTHPEMILAVDTTTGGFDRGGVRGRQEAVTTIEVELEQAAFRTWQQQNKNETKNENEIHSKNKYTPAYKITHTTVVMSPNAKKNDPDYCFRERLSRLSDCTTVQLVAFFEWRNQVCMFLQGGLRSALFIAPVSILF